MLRMWNDAGKYQFLCKWPLFIKNQNLMRAHGLHVKNYYGLFLGKDLLQHMDTHRHYEIHGNIINKIMVDYFPHVIILAMALILLVGMQTKPIPEQGFH